ncbi:LysR family transcriptional regulator [Mycobacterium sp. NPDC048908]|uniref:LysR family transcriptional regulator n=1 Tax=Mycobacterium sp. NPDC048908 TaxID=3364292 RepID=UPI00371DBB6D
MEYFVAVAERGSIAAAASDLPISQSAVSVAISELENIVGVRLLHRVRARGVTLTAAGTALLPEVRSLVTRARELERNAADIGGSLAGELRVALDPVLTPVLLPGVMSGFLSRYPGVDFSFEEGTSDEAQDWLIQGRCDVVLMYDLGVRDSLSAHPLFAAQPKVLVAQELVGPDSHSIALRSLEDEPMILIDISPGEAFYRAILSRAGVTPRVVHRTSSVEGVRALVARGFGWSMLLQQSRTKLSYEGRAYRELDIADDVPHVAVVAVTPRGRLTRRTAAFCDYCTKFFGSGPGSWL